MQKSPRNVNEQTICCHYGSVHYRAFKAGQFVLSHGNRWGAGCEAVFVVSPAESELEIFFNIVPDWSLTPELASM